VRQRPQDASREAGRAQDSGEGLLKRLARVSFLEVLGESLFESFIERDPGSLCVASQAVSPNLRRLERRPGLAVRRVHINLYGFFTA
jgi:hypothetical protein